MSPLAGVFFVSLAASLLYTRLEETPKDVGREGGLFNTLKSIVFKRPSSQSEDQNEGFGHMEFLPPKGEQEVFANGVKDMEDLDICVFLIVARNQKYCIEPQSEDSLNRLTLLLLHCQVRPAGSRPRVCKADQTFAECTVDMDEADWTSFGTLKKRALSVCQGVSQQLFVRNSQRHVQSLMETARSQTSFLATFKDGHEILENISSTTLARLQGQSRQFFQHIKQLQDYFRRKESIFIEAARLHTALLARQGEMVSGLEDDINVLTERFLGRLELLHGNITATGEMIFARHREIMLNLDQVKLSTDQILAQLGTLQDCEGGSNLDLMLSWIGNIAHHWSAEDLLELILPYFIFAWFSVYFKLSKPLRLAVLALLATGMIAKWSYILQLFGPCLLLGVNSLHSLLVKRFFPDCDLPEDNLSDDNSPDDNLPEDNSSDDSSSQDNFFEDDDTDTGENFHLSRSSSTTLTGNLPRESVPQESLPQDNFSENNLSEDNLSEGNLSEDDPFENNDVNTVESHDLLRVSSNTLTEPVQDAVNGTTVQAETDIETVAVQIDTSGHSLRTRHKCGYQTTEGTKCKRFVSFGPPDACCYQHRIQ